jgi:hypothetical protein
VALVGVAAALWTGLVLVGYFPDVAREALAPLGLTDPDRADGPGDLIRPTTLALGHLAGVAWRLLGLAYLFWVALALGATLLHVTRLARDRSSVREGLVALAVGLGAVSYLLLAMAGAGLMTRAGVAVLMAALGIHACVSTWRARAVLRVLVARARAPWRAARRGAERAAWFVGAIVLVVFAGVGLVGALGPEVEFDALWYHLWLPREHLAAGTLVDAPQEYPSLYPQNVELLFAWGLTWGGEVPAELVHFGLGLLAAGATYVLARRVTGAGWALLAAAVVVSTPTVTWEMTTAYNDLAIAAFVPLALIELLAWREDRDPVRPIRSAVLLGLALASKHLALLFLAPLAVVVVVVAFAAPRRGTVTRWARAGWALAAGVVYSAVALALAAPWYLRSAWLTGNPVFPELHSVFGAPADRWDDTAQSGLESFTSAFGPDRDPLSLLALPWILTTQPDRFDGSIGPIFLAAAPLLVLAWRDRPPGLGTIAFAAAAFLALWASPLSSFQGRFLVAVVPLLAVLAVVGLASLARLLGSAGWRAAAVAVPVVAGAIVLLNVPPLIPWHGRTVADTPEGRIGFVNHTVREVDLAAALQGGAAAERRRAADVTGARAVACANRVAPEGSRILTYVEGLQFLSDHPLLVFFAVRARPVIASLDEDPPAAAARRLREAGITHLLVGGRWTEEARPVLERLGERLVAVCDEDGVTLYELRAPGG